MPLPRVAARSRAVVRSCTTHLNYLITFSGWSRILPSEHRGGCGQLKPLDVGVLHHVLGEAGHGELRGEGHDVVLERLYVCVALERGHEVAELLTRGGLDRESDLRRTVKELGDLLEVRLIHAAGGASGSAHARAAWGHRGAVARHGVLVQRDVHLVAELLELGAREALRAQVPEDEVVVRAVGHDAVPQRPELVAHGLGVLHHLLGVHLVVVGHDLLELGGHAGDLVLVRASLERGEDRVVDEVLEAALVLAEEDHAGARAAEGLVRRGGHDVADVEGALEHAGSDEAGGVRHVAHEQRAVLVSDGAEAFVVPIARVRGAAHDDESRLEERGGLAQLLHVDEAGLRVHAVGQRLEVHAGGAHGLAAAVLLGQRVEAVGQVSSRRQVQPHDAVMRPQQRGVHGEVGRRAAVRLHVHAPLGLVTAVGLEGPVNAHVLDLVHDLVAAVVAGAGQALGVLVGQRGAQAVHHGARRKVLGRDQLQRAPLALLLALDELVERRVVHLQGHIAGEGLGNAGHSAAGSYLEGLSSRRRIAGNGAVEALFSGRKVSTTAESLQNSAGFSPKHCSNAAERRTRALAPSRRTLRRLGIDVARLGARGAVSTHFCGQRARERPGVAIR
eukprot:scaffold363_cov255-Pinguiococcus_pyrenoidosus.AAC.15